MSKILNSLEKDTIRNALQSLGTPWCSYIPKSIIFDIRGQSITSPETSDPILKYLRSLPEHWKLSKKPYSLLDILNRFADIELCEKVKCLKMHNVYVCIFVSVLKQCWNAVSCIKMCQKLADSSLAQRCTWEVLRRVHGLPSSPATGCSPSAPSASRWSPQWGRRGAWWPPWAPQAGGVHVLICPGP